MHIILIILLVLSGLVWGIVNLQREIRRRQWQKQNTTPLFSIKTPKELTAVLLFGLVRCGGDPTSDEKNRLIATYRSELGYSDKDAAEMYAYASYVVGTDTNFSSKAAEIMSPALGNYAEGQKQSAITLLEGLVEHSISAQDAFLKSICEQFGR